ncbi:MAG: globin [Methanoregulaceae archaeon]|jgi:hemoglobin-like flavoprotein|nr:globin [Methanoregulaceae archaeon]
MTEVAAFTASLDRCLEEPRFIPEFYQRFLSASDEVRHKFAMTNFDDQERRLARSLRVLGAAVTGDPAALRHLAKRAESHDRHHLDIKYELYDLWRESLLQTASEIDPHWNDETDTSWQVVLDHAIHYMTKRY